MDIGIIVGLISVGVISALLFFVIRKSNPASSTTTPNVQDKDRVALQEQDEVWLTTNITKAPHID